MNCFFLFPIWDVLLNMMLRNLLPSYLCASRCVFRRAWRRKAAVENKHCASFQRSSHVLDLEEKLLDTSLHLNSCSTNYRPCTSVLRSWVNMECSLGLYWEKWEKQWFSSWLVLYGCHAAKLLKIMLFILSHAWVSSTAYTVSFRISFLLPNSFLCGKLCFSSLFLKRKEKKTDVQTLHIWVLVLGLLKQKTFFVIFTVLSLILVMKLNTWICGSLEQLKWELVALFY